MAISIDSAGIPEELLRQVEESDAQLVFERDGSPVAVLVSARFMKAFRELAEELENRLDLHAYKQAKQESVESGEEAVPYQEFCTYRPHQVHSSTDLPINDRATESQNV